MRAIRRRSTDLDRRALVRDTIRIRLKHLLRRGGSSEVVLGRRVRFTERATFTLLFEEIFVNEQYRLSSDALDDAFIIDAGANIGMAALYFTAVRPNGRILAIEPDPDAAALLRANTDGLPGVEVLEAALGETDGSTTLFRDRPGSVLATTSPGAFDDAVEVRTVRLSSRVEPRTALVKLDIEGAEATVLRELADAGALANIDALAVEAGLHHPDPTAHELGPILTLLAEHGFDYAISAYYLPPLDEAAPQNVLVRARRRPMG